MIEKAFSKMLISILSTILVFTCYLIFIKNEYIPKTVILVLILYIAIFVQQTKKAFYIGILFSLFWIYNFLIFERYNSDIGSYDFLYSLSFLGLNRYFVTVELYVVINFLVYFIFQVMRKKKVKKHQYEQSAIPLNIILEFMDSTMI